jgi:hypothetical protein
MSTDKEENTSSDKLVRKPSPQVSAEARRLFEIYRYYIASFLVIIAFYLSPLHFHFKIIITGAGVIIAGTAFSLLFAEWKGRNWKLAVFIGIFLAVGAILSTYGWNEKTTVEYKNNIIRSVSMEWKMNASILLDQKFHEPNETKIAKYTVFPRMQTAVLAGALSSGHFTDKSDPNFWTKGLSLNEVLGNFNNRLRITENKMDIPPNSIYEWRTKIRDGKGLKSILKKMYEFGIMLKNEYGKMLKNEYGEKFDVSQEEIDEINKKLSQIASVDVATRHH